MFMMFLHLHVNRKPYDDDDDNNNDGNSTIRKINIIHVYSTTCLKQPLKKRPKIGLKDRLSLNAGQKYCRMLPLEHSAILLTFIKLPFAIRTFILSIFEWPLKTGFTVTEAPLPNYG